MNNKQAHEKLSLFHSYCEEYNHSGLVEVPPRLLPIYQSIIIECLELFKFIWSKEQTETSRAYMVFSGKILLRLSYLRHHGRKETDQETSEYFADFSKRYNLTKWSDI